MLKMKEKAVMAGFIISSLVSMTGFSGTSRRISDKVLRLHIVANSDSDEDQALKIKVRDRILTSCSEEFKSAGNLECAESIAESDICKIKDEADKEIHAAGFSYSVNAEIKNMYFNTRRYDTVTLPAGEYKAVRVTIGEGKGKNWWCVMFPPMCLPAAEERRELDEVPDVCEMDLVEGGQKYEIKFKILEIFNDIKNFFADILGFSEI